VKECQKTAGRGGIFLTHTVDLKDLSYQFSYQLL